MNTSAFANKFSGDNQKSTPANPEVTDVDDFEVAGPVDEITKPETPAPSPAGNVFAQMKKLKTQTVDDIDDAPEMEEEPEIENEDEPEEIIDDDDFEVSEQLDHVDPPSENSTPEATGNLENTAEPASTGERSPEFSSDASPSIPAGMPNPGEGGINPEDLKKAQEEQFRQQQGMGRGPGVGGGGGLGLGSSFKGWRNGLRKEADTSLPKAMSAAEIRANKDPKRAAEFYKTAGDEVIREKLYRDNFHGINSDMAAAEEAKSRYVAGVSDFNRAVEQAAMKTELAKMAKENGSSIGDYINAVTSGTISNAAAQSIVKTLDDDSGVKAAQDNLLKASSDFQTSVNGASKKAATLETNFPGRADMQMRANQLKQMSDELSEQSPSKINEKIKKLQKEMDEFIQGIIDSIKKITNAAVSKMSGGPAPK